MFIEIGVFGMHSRNRIIFVFLAVFLAVFTTVAGSQLEKVTRQQVVDSFRQTVCLVAEEGGEPVPIYGEREMCGNAPSKGVDFLVDAAIAKHFAIFVSVPPAFSIDPDFSGVESIPEDSRSREIADRFLTDANFRKAFFMAVSLELVESGARCDDCASVAKTRSVSIADLAPYIGAFVTPAEDGGLRFCSAYEAGVLTDAQLLRAGFVALYASQLRPAILADESARGDKLSARVNALLDDAQIQASVCETVNRYSQALGIQCVSSTRENGNERSPR